MLAQLICAHLIGDFLLQNHWMQQKSKSTWVCFVHVVVYALPFLWAFTIYSLPPIVLGAILVQHFLQDRFTLHLKWMRWYEQTTPDIWPVGPLCVDQAWHIAFIWLFAGIAGIA